MLRIIYTTSSPSRLRTGIFRKRYSHTTYWRRCSTCYISKMALCVQNDFPCFPTFLFKFFLIFFAIHLMESETFPSTVKIGLCVLELYRQRGKPDLFLYIRIY
ncbi:unnamed protein product [Chrysodeixis includens]|uniref:Uncharacterized protein n=1 Tax=Chrysodeixis includens TaxID=689277 RepID=A0A9N8PZB5_CHRIL|nr:unnamed protein product [Chrysodeixis includens]